MEPETTPQAVRPDAVTLAYVHEHQVSFSWHLSMMRLIGYDAANGGNIANGGWIGMRCGTDGLPEARNNAVKAFLSETTADWLFWIDTDMGFPADTVERLLDAADPVERPVVGALCFTQQEVEGDDFGGYRVRAVPTVYDWANLDGQKGWLPRFRFTPNAVTRVGGTGSACILIHRGVFEQIEVAQGPTWYNRVPNATNGRLIGEDLSFCLRCGALNIPIYVHTGVPTTHFKRIWLGEGEYWQQVSLASAAESYAAAQDAEVSA